MFGIGTKVKPIATATFNCAFIKTMTAFWNDGKGQCSHCLHKSSHSMADETSINSTNLPLQLTLILKNIPHICNNCIRPHRNKKKSFLRNILFNLAIGLLEYVLFIHLRRLFVHPSSLFMFYVFTLYPTVRDNERTILLY